MNEMSIQIYKLSFAVCFLKICPLLSEIFAKGPSPTEYIGRIVAHQSTKMAATMTGSSFLKYLVSLARSSFSSVR